MKSALGPSLLVTFTLHTISAVFVSFNIIGFVKNENYSTMIEETVFAVQEYLILFMLADLAEDCYSHLQSNLTIYW